MVEARIDIIQTLKPILNNVNPRAHDVLDFYMWLQQPENPVRQRLLLADNRSRNQIALINTSIN
jgi:hypothetical protein